ncbi:hypothetical protein H0H87_000839 [Tephrocybe sp. NHM501043]|nr:hypothetical protein H0H87_000839 [Tephrocybe sp. NHM501043]
MKSTTNAGCFSGFSLRSLLNRRSTAENDNVEPKVQDCWTIDSKVCCEVLNCRQWLIVCQHDHGLCSGEDWILTPGRPPSYSAPPEYAINDSKNPALDTEVVKTIESKLDELDPELRQLSLKIHDHPEVGFQEKYAHDVMTQFMEKHGFKVTRHYAGLKTAWRAEFSVGRGGRVVGVNSEMDALPGIGHACGHNLIAICGLGTAVAVKAALVAHNIPGKVVILGTPAEEGGGGKIILLERGAYRDMDVCLMAHPAPGELNSSGDGSTTAAQTMFIEYTGKTAHAAAAPWEGINALDAAVAAYNAISALRQQMKPDLRVHGIIQGSNWTPNVIPDNSKLTYIARASNKAELLDLVDRVKACFQAAALATGCTVKVEMIPAYFDLRQNPVLSREYGNSITNRCRMIMNHASSSASTDFGNVSYELPSLHPLYVIPTEPEGSNHTIKFTRAARTKEAHDVTIKVAKGLALTGLRVLSDSLYFDEVCGADILLFNGAHWDVL